MCSMASGKLLKAVLTFNGHPQGRIATWEFPTYPQEMIYTCQDNAWMDERVMLFWVDQALKPYVIQAGGVIPILFLNSYQCHITENIHDISLSSLLLCLVGITILTKKDL